MTSDSTDPPAEIFLIIHDIEQSTATLFRSDGKCSTIPLGTDGPDYGRISRVTIALDVRAVIVRTDNGDEIIAELPLTDGGECQHGRPVVYLDQNHWNTLANALHAPGRVRGTDELSAAQALIALVRSRGVILPISGGHLSETAKWSDDARRYQLGLTMYQLSGGWHMVDPLDIRRREIRNTLAARYRKENVPTAHGVFRLAADAVRGETRGVKPYEPPSDLPDDDRTLLAGLVPLLANIATVLDKDAIPVDHEPAWAEGMQRFTDWLAAEPTDLKHLRQSRTGVLFRQDTSKEIAEEAHRSGITVEQFGEWLRDHADADIGFMPMLGLYREALREKVANPGTRWEPNDLFDLMYLACAAGYADYVVGERSATAQLRQASKRLGRSPRLYNSLVGLMGDLAATT